MDETEKVITEAEGSDVGITPWPSLSVVRAALRGFRLIVLTEGGCRVAGVLASGAPWIVWDGSVVGCERCRKVQANPPPVSLDSEKAVRLPSGGSPHALRVLAELLHPFYRAHVACGAAGQSAGFVVE